jgi:hypothetical protein
MLAKQTVSLVQFLLMSLFTMREARMWDFHDNGSPSAIALQQSWPGSGGTRGVRLAI